MGPCRPRGWASAAAAAAFRVSFLFLPSGLSCLGLCAACSTFTAAAAAAAAARRMCRRAVSTQSDVPRMNMAVLNSEVASIVVHASAGAKSLDENSQRAPPILALDLTEQRAATPVMLHASSDDKYAEDSHADSQRSSGRSRTPTRRLAESNLKDSTRLIFLSGETGGDGGPSPDAADGEAGGARRGRRPRSAESQAAEERPEKKRRGASAGAEGASSRPKRSAAVLGEVKREICMEKLYLRRAGKSGSSGKLSSLRQRHSGNVPNRAAAGGRRQERQASGGGVSERRVRSGGEKVLNGRLRKLPVVKPGTGSKTRLDLGSHGASSSNGASAGKAAAVPGKSAVGVDDADDVSTGSSEQGTSHRRDWGLMEVDAVGRNRPPFARTMLYHGTVPFPLPADLSDQAAARNWVIKRWPEKTNRRKIDQEVHECIKAHPHPYLVRIVDVSPSEGVLME